MEDEKYNINAGFHLPKIITFIPSSKNAIKNVVDLYLEQVLDNSEIEILESECMLKTLGDIIKEIRDNENYKNAVNREASKYPDKDFNYKRFKLIKVSTTSYDYKEDSKWSQVKAELTKREMFLKNLLEPMATEDGEMIFPAIKKRTEYLQIKPTD